VAVEQVAGHRIQSLGDLNVVITGELGMGVDRQVVGLPRRGQQPGRLGQGEMLRRAQRGRAVPRRPAAVAHQIWAHRCACGRSMKCSPVKNEDRT
jgi:hypothetical protein